MKEVAVGALEDIDDPGCREFAIGDGDWPFRGFVVRQGGDVFAYQNFCVHAGHPLNWKPDEFLTKDKSALTNHSDFLAPLPRRNPPPKSSPSRGGGLLLSSRAQPLFPPPNEGEG